MAASFTPEVQNTDQLKALMRDVHVGDNEVQKRVFKVDLFDDRI